MNKISPYATAQLLAINAALYSDEKNKEVSRYRFSREALRNISGWGRLSAPFVEELAADLCRLGWILIDFSDSEFAIIQASKITVWPKLSSKRLRADDALWTINEDEINAAYLARFPANELSETES